MRFTQEDILQIKKGLLALSKKDTEFPIASTLTGTEELALVQNGQNVKAHIKDFVTQLFLLGVPDFLNITDKYNERNISLLQAISLIPYRGRKLGQVITFLNDEGNWVLYQFQGERLNQWNNLTLWVDLIERIAGIATVVPDEEDIHGIQETVGEETKTILKFKDKVYNQDDFSGLGRVYLRKNIVSTVDPNTGGSRKINLLTQQMLSKENTIYQIQYDFSLNSQTINVPEGAVLDFKYGGNFTNGTLNCINTTIRIDNFDSLGVTLIGDYTVVSALNEDNSPYINNTKPTNGLGHIYLRKSYFLTQSDFNQSNTIYHIRYDYDLNNKTINIPENSTLEFEGGSINNGKLVSNNTIISGLTKSTAILLGEFYKDNRLLQYNSYDEYSYNTSFKLSALITPSNGRTPSDVRADINTAINLGITNIIPILQFNFKNNTLEDATFNLGIKDINEYISMFKSKGINITSLKCQYSIIDTTEVTGALMDLYNSKVKSYYNDFLNAGFNIKEIYPLNEYEGIVGTNGQTIDLNSCYPKIVELREYFKSKGLKVIYNHQEGRFNTVDSRIYNLGDAIGLDIYPAMFIGNSNSTSIDDGIKYINDKINKASRTATKYSKEFYIAECGQNTSSTTNNTSPESSIVNSFDCIFGALKNSNVKGVNIYTIYTITDRNLTSQVKQLLTKYYG